MEEVIAATAYLDLFIRTATEPSLVRAFVKFVTTEKYDDVSILESLITRIQSNSRVSDDVTVSVRSYSPYASRSVQFLFGNEHT